MSLHGTQTIGKNGHLYIGGSDAVRLAEKFGTPLYVYDTALIKQKIRLFQEAFSRHSALNWQIAYASKAFSTLAMIQLAGDFGLSLDVVSGGELYTALKAGFPPERIHFHGNNKSADELARALDAKIGTVIVDNFSELSMLEQMCAARGQKIEILLRITPGVEAHTHEFIMTGHDDTKFGFNLDNGMAERAVFLALHSEHLILKGLHCHIGSQIFETEGFIRAIRALFSHMNEWEHHMHFRMKVLNVGGGFGIKYTSKDHPLPIGRFIDVIADTIEDECARHSLRIPEVWIEPGRSIVGEAGTTLYTLGSSKTIPGIREFISIDGGMTDNIRPALYQANYEAICANRADEPAEKKVTIAGKCCETGDVLIKDAFVPESCKMGDILAVFCTGAYGYSMASHYNRLPNPAVVFVEDGEASIVVRRETYEDLIRNDVPLRTFSSRQ
ncbi:diaminopimelate decarboxylase [Sporolactobacillus sp. KGMB 08714]|uniref:diaminopimelate decarboxylase n=1 Tax=Sporolactobacillus sp. KGMB 08714 TaxID=3064704 RepID=UPI002FBDFF14